MDIKSHRVLNFPLHPFLYHFVIQTTVGRKDPDNIKVDAIEILRYAQDDKKK
jgi:hypothetical protein